MRVVCLPPPLESIEYLKILVIIVPFRTFRSGWGREQRGKQDADKGEVRRVFPWA